ncbi:MAG: peptidylprolyl isomerase [Bacteroidales bacterium]|nr:peptidylprolyl isomerase [Candidatus Cacconaster scatequi]
MNRRIFLMIVALLTGVCLPASGQNYGPGVVEKSVAIVGNEVIMISQVEGEAQMMRARGSAVDESTRCEILEQMLISKLFISQAKIDSLLVNEANVIASLDGRVNELIQTLGGEKQVEEYFGKPMHKLRTEWENILREQSLMQQMQQNVMQDIPALTPRDIERYYNDTPQEDLPMVSTKYRIRQIGIYPDKKAAELAVKERLIELRERILKGEKFATLARLYSQDPGTMAKGGELGMAPRSMFWPVFSDAAMSLKVGQVSQVVETPDGFHIIQLIERNGDMFNARHILIKPQYTSEDREKGFEKLDSLRNIILSDSLTFAAVARYYSQEKKSATSGGLMADEYTGSSYFEKDQLKPADYAVLRNMEVGDISEPFESLDNEGRNGNTIYKILYLDKVLPSHVANYKDDFDVLANELNKINSQKAIDKFIKEKQKVNYIVLDPFFEGCSFRYPGWGK